MDLTVDTIMDVVSTHSDSKSIDARLGMILLLRQEYRDSYIVVEPTKSGIHNFTPLLGKDNICCYDYFHLCYLHEGHKMVVFLSKEELNREVNQAFSDLWCRRRVMLYSFSCKPTDLKKFIAWTGVKGISSSMIEQASEKIGGYYCQFIALFAMSREQFYYYFLEDVNARNKVDDLHDFISNIVEMDFVKFCLFTGIFPRAREDILRKSCINMIKSSEQSTIALKDCWVRISTTYGERMFSVVQLRSLSYPVDVLPPLTIHTESKVYTIKL